jgi:hypothetical protein
MAGAQRALGASKFVEPLRMDPIISISACADLSSAHWRRALPVRYRKCDTP